MRDRALRCLAGALIWVVLLPSLAAEWTTLENCRLIPHPSNDGDSFHVQHDGKEFIFRLYFVDAAETDESYKERVTEQAAHFGIPYEKSLLLGEAGATSTAKWLARNFTVRTRFQDAKGRSSIPRYFAFVETSDGRDLAELLTTNGLARAYGFRAIHPSGLSAKEQVRHYQALEAQAKRRQVGAYHSGGDGNMLPTDLPTEPNRRAGGSNSDSSGKVNLNTATQAELEKLPRIGPKLADLIIQNRPFSSADELQTLRGIGPATVAALEPLVTP